MRIGEFAKKHQTPVDSVYYYINLGLLVPQKMGKQYYFDAVCEKDMERIVLYKSWGFSLKDIHNILSLFRISALHPPQDVLDVINIMQNKYDNLQREKEVIEDNQRRIKEAQEHIIRTIPQTQSQTSGVPVSMLNLLQCPDCQGQLQMKGTDMNQRFIINSDISCKCGYKAQIRNGIFLTPNKNASKYDWPDLTREFYKDLPPDLISLYQRSYNWMGNQLKRIGTAGKVLMETHINAYFYLQFELQHLDLTGAKIIIADKFPEMLALYKDLIDRQGFEVDILYLADDSTNWPLKPACIDVFLDFFSYNEHQFYRHTSLAAEINPYLAENAYMLGTYFYFVNGHKSMRKLLAEYPEASKENFNIKIFQRELAQHGYNILEENHLGYTVDSGEKWCFDFHITGEEMHLMPYLARYSPDK
jgi:DNA-binding transcriptional MerR regulator